MSISDSVRSANTANGKTASQSGSYNRGSNNEANYGGVASGQEIDWSATANFRGAFDGLWRDSPLGFPATYGMILSAAARTGVEAGNAGLSTGESASGNSGQAAIIQQMGPDVMNNAWHYQINGYGSAADYIRLHCAYPSAVEQIIDQMSQEVESTQSS